MEVLSEGYVSPDSLRSMNLPAGDLIETRPEFSMFSQHLHQWLCGGAESSRDSRESRDRSGV